MATVLTIDRILVKISCGGGSLTISNQLLLEFRLK